MPTLMELMVRAGFEEVFIGIETPCEAEPAESGKVQNKNRDLLASVKCLQRAGLQVHGGFIVGFDSDPPAIFDRQIRFIQESGIVTAMVGLLTALRGTRLYQRMSREGRLLGEGHRQQYGGSLNFIPRMEPKTLIAGYRAILDSIYAPKNYYQRVIRLLREYRPLHQGKFHLQPGYVGALFKSMLYLGIMGKERFHYWKLFFWSLAKAAAALPPGHNLRRVRLSLPQGRRAGHRLRHVRRLRRLCRSTTRPNRFPACCIAGRRPSPVVFHQPAPGNLFVGIGLSVLLCIVRFMARYPRSGPRRASVGIFPLPAGCCIEPGTLHGHYFQTPRG
jgi:hypothetical protein